MAVTAHKRHRRHGYTLDELPENVPVEVVEHRLPEEDLVCPNCDTGWPIVLYEYQPGRGACYPQAFLNGFKGYLHTDGYSGYHNLPAALRAVR